MKVKNIARFCAITMSLLPAFTYADDIHVTNNTKSFGTGYFYFSPCSSVLGDRGILKPGQTDFVIPDKIIKVFCGSFECNAYVFNTKNCSGKKEAVVRLSASRGVISIDNRDSAHYSVSGSGTHLVITQIAKSGFVDWLKSLFS